MKKLIALSLLVISSMTAGQRPLTESDNHMISGNGPVVKIHKSHKKLWVTLAAIGAGAIVGSIYAAEHKGSQTIPQLNRIDCGECHQTGK